MSGPVGAIGYTGMEFGDPGRYLCVCSEEFCFCANTVDGLDVACPECARGAHVWTPGGARDKVDETHVWTAGRRDPTDPSIGLTGQRSRRWRIIAETLVLYGAVLGIAFAGVWLALVLVGRL